MNVLRLHPEQIFNCRYRELFKMQTSIKMFFKSKQTETGADSDLGTGNCSGPPVTSQAKRPADESGDEVVKKKHITASISTPTKENISSSPNDNLPSTPKTPSSQIVKDTPIASPLIDVNVLIRKKISSGASCLHENIGVSWFRALQAEFDKPYFKKLSAFVQKQRLEKVVFPPEDKVYAWTHHHEIRETRVVILGQDPYHGPNQAHGLSFSVQQGIRLPPSLINIFKELESDISGFVTPRCGDLTGWSKQGVLMLNTCLSVNQGVAFSHQGQGWEVFTDAVISWLSKNSRTKLVFMLWGKPAQKKATMIDKRHEVLKSAHPSPLSAHNGFFGCAHFSKANKFLKQQGLPEIDWKNL